MGLHGSLVSMGIPAQRAEKPDGPPCGHSMGNASPWIHYKDHAASNSRMHFLWPLYTHSSTLRFSKEKRAEQRKYQTPHLHRKDFLISFNRVYNYIALTEKWIVNAIYITNLFNISLQKLEFCVIYKSYVRIVIMSHESNPLISTPMLVVVLPCYVFAWHIITSCHNMQCILLY